MPQPLLDLRHPQRRWQIWLLGYGLHYAGRNLFLSHLSRTRVKREIYCPDALSIGIARSLSTGRFNIYSLILKFLFTCARLSSAAVGWDKTENKRVCPASWLVVLLGRLRMNDRITSPLLLAMPWNVWRHQSPSSASYLLSARFCFSHYFSHGDRPDRAQRRRFQSGLLLRNKSFLKLNLQFITVDVMQEYNNF